MRNIFDIYNKSNLIIQSFELSEVLNKNGEYKKQALYLPIGWQKATKSNININVSGHLLLTGHKINDKYVIGIDISIINVCLCQNIRNIYFFHTIKMILSKKL